MSTLREDILNCNDYATRVVNVWNKSFKVRTMSLEQLIKFNALQKEVKDNQNFSKLLVQVAIWSCVDDSDNYIFNDSDAEALSKKSQKALTKIFNTAVELVNLNEESIEAEKKS